MEYGLIAGWWLLFQALSLAGLPVAATLLRPLPDRGAAFALPVALVLVWMPVYWVGHLRFGPIALAAGVVVLGAAALWTARAGVPVRLDRHAEAMAVFTVAFGLLVALRAADPSIYPAGGEKFLDYGLLRSVLAASRLPPPDIWFAGEPVSYYYGGHLLAGILTSLTGTAAPYAYNLALAGTYATLATAAYGLAGSIADARGAPYRVAGLLGAFLVAVASNLYTPVRRLLMVLPDVVARPVAAAIEAETAVDPGAVLGGEGFFYWTASRVVPGTINEFPFFAFLNGDLHAHMVSTPFLLLVAAIGLAYALTPAAAVNRRRALVLGAVPPVAGMLAVVNTWSLPSAIGLTWLALALADADPASLLPTGVARRLPTAPRWRAEAVRTTVAAAIAVVAGAFAVAWALPFFLGPAGGRAIAFLPPRSGAIPFLLVHGGFLLVFWVFLGTLLVRRDRGRWPVAGAAALAVVGVGLLAKAAAVSFVLPVLVAAWLLRRADRGPGYEAVLIVAGAGLALVVEFAYVQELAGPGRMNTVFKTYMQVWVLWGTAAGVGLARLPGVIRGLSPDLERGDAHPVVGADGIVAVAAAVLLVSVALYPGLALGSHVGSGDGYTLDATTYASRGHPAEWEAIVWLDGRPDRGALVTAPACWCHGVESVRPYRWANAPSSFTGRPTVAGWQHEIGYRGAEPYRARVADVETIYTGTPTERAALLRRYDVRYVYVGPNERAVYGDSDFTGEPGLSVAFENEAVTIHVVDRDELGG